MKPGARLEQQRVAGAAVTISPILPGTRSPFRCTPITAASKTVRKFASRMLLADERRRSSRSRPRPVAGWVRPATRVPPRRRSAGTSPRDALQVDDRRDRPRRRPVRSPSLMTGRLVPTGVRASVYRARSRRGTDQAGAAGRHPSMLSIDQRAVGLDAHRAGHVLAASLAERVRSPATRTGEQPAARSNGDVGEADRRQSGRPMAGASSKNPTRLHAGVDRNEPGHHERRARADDGGRCCRGSTRSSAGSGSGWGTDPRALSPSRGRPASSSRRSARCSERRRVTADRRATAAGCRRLFVSMRRRRDGATDGISRASGLSQAGGDHEERADGRRGRGSRSPEKASVSSRARPPRRA